jgi:hypothetical protein
VAGNLDLARAAGEKGLEREKRLLHLRVVAASPDHDEANEFLGHRRAAGGWLVGHRGRWFPVSRLDEVHSDWNDAWEIETSHWRLRTNLPTARAVETAIDLERFYLLFVERFGPVFGLADPGLPLLVDLHRDRDSFPERGSNRATYLDESSNCVIAHASGGLKRDLLFGAAAGAIVRACGGVSAPPWLVAGIVEVGAAIGGKEGEGIDLVRVDRGSMRAYARAPHAISLDELLRLRASDFEASPKAALRRAQSYALLQFCLEGETYRERFAAYAREAVRGKRGDFRREVADGAFEAAWLEHVRALAGVE